jgi:hypothetical protein
MESHTPMGQGLEWLVKRTDEEPARYLAVWNNAFVWIYDKEAALRFMSEHHAETIADAMVMPCAPFEEPATDESTADPSDT